MHEVAGDAATYTLRGQEFRVSGPAWECPDTHTRYVTPEQANVALARLHHAWRAQRGIAKEDLQRRAKVLGLSDKQASALLGFGVNQYRTYKTTDKLPSQSNARLLQLLCDDRALPALLEAAGPALNKITRRKLLAYMATASKPHMSITRLTNIMAPGNWSATLNTHGLRTATNPQTIPSHLAIGMTPFAVG